MEAESSANPSALLDDRLDQAAAAAPEAEGGEEEEHRWKYHDDEPLDLTYYTDDVVWLMKVPDMLKHRWENVKEPGKVLGKLRVYDPLPGQTERTFELLVPNTHVIKTEVLVEEEPQPPPEEGDSAIGAVSLDAANLGTGTPGQIGADGNGASSSDPNGNLGDGQNPVPGPSRLKKKEEIVVKKLVEGDDVEEEIVYELNDSLIPQSQRDRKWLYSERERKVGFYGKSRFRAYPRLLAKANKEAILVPKLTEKVRARMIRERYQDPALQKRRIRLLADENLTTGQMNTLVSGAPAQILKTVMSSRFAEKANQPIQVPVPAAAPKKLKSRERTVALPEGPLRDAIAGEFEKYKYWSFKALKERLNQPENHLKKVLSSMAYVEKSGPYRNYWTPRLDLPMFKHQDVGEVGELAPEQQESLPTFTHAEDDEEDEDEDMEEEDDMEEVM